MFLPVAGTLLESELGHRQYRSVRSPSSLQLTSQSLEGSVPLRTTYRKPPYSAQEPNAISKVVAGKHQRHHSQEFQSLSRGANRDTCRPASRQICGTDKKS